MVYVSGLSKDEKEIFFVAVRNVARRMPKTDNEDVIRGCLLGAITALSSVYNLPEASVGYAILRLNDLEQRTQDESLEDELFADGWF